MTFDEWLVEECGVNNGWSFFEKEAARRTWQAALEWAASQQEPVYPLPDDLYPGSKDWKHSNYAGRVEWLHSMYESKKKEADFWVDVASKNIPEAECQAREEKLREALEKIHQCVDALAREDERYAFESDAEQYGFDLERYDCPVVEPWSEYKSEATGHRWAGWLAAKGVE